MPVHLPHIDDEQELALLGISCHERDYRMVWRLNKQLNWNLERWDDFLLETNEHKSWHSCFRMLLEDENINITLYRNKSGGGILISELAQFDYVVKIENSTDDFLAVVKFLVKKIPGILALMEFDTSRIRSTTIL